MDDAIWVSSIDEGWVVRVSIADVARQVPPGSPLDSMARERGATRYFASGNSPMLPWDLSEGSLSLFPHKIRKSLNVEVTLDREARVTSKSVSLGEVVSQAKLSYTEIPDILAREDHPQHADIRAAKNLTQGLLIKRRDAGALIFYDLTKGWVTTEDGTLKKMKRRDDTVGYIIIQELMILTNVVMAQYMAENAIPTLFRNHEAKSAAPQREALMKDIASLLDAPVIDLESLQKQNHLLFKRAEYGAECVGHYGLNEKAYLHFTSPIRRYADLVVHQQIRAHLKGEPLPYTQEQVVTVATHLNTLMQEMRDRTKQMHVNRAENQARQNIEARKLDGLSAKDFERAVKVEVRSGGSPSDALVEAWTHRLDQNNIPNLCVTEVLMHINGADGWEVLQEAAVEALEERPADAIAVLNQAQSLGWEAVDYEGQQTGPAHAPTFTAKARLRVDLLGTFEATVMCSVGGSARLVKQRSGVELLRNIVLGRVGPQETVVIQGAALHLPTPTKKVEVDLNKNPISVLMELSQTKKIPAPSYSFDLKGPPHMPIVTCTATFDGWTIQAIAAKKQDAKAAAAQGLLEKLSRG